MPSGSKSQAPPYRGKLSAKSASAGIAMAKANAKRLLADAESLFEAKRYPSACAIACLAIEETSKPAVIRKILLADSPKQVRMGWKLFSSHRVKSTPWIVPNLISMDHDTYEDFVEDFLRHQDPVLLTSLKQLSIYCGCYGNCHWADPQDVIEKEQAETVLYSARILTLSGQTSPVDSPDGLDLWQDHMKGCFSAGYIASNNRIIQFFQRAADTALLTNSQIPKEVAFDFMTTALILGDGKS